VVLCAASERTHLVEEVVVAHGAVAQGSSNHVVLDVDHAGPGCLHRHHVEALSSQVVARDEGHLLTLSEGADLTAQRGRKEEEEEDEEGGQHRTRKETDKSSVERKESVR